ncbi:MAG: hypothetical protein B6D76_06545 [gamma proteobacterium symbiont of Stewartia floridana]|nr:MAG: hypothetical protein B6D76_06545 [gamma proteobacterium symbiont of Stewartia floridana]RLW61703.1 MAG: hypothetical protein B6D75_01355 [gamma proteobacterium symbiont of Stewartia floridana]
MNKRRFAELSPFLIAFLSAIVFFGMSNEVVEWYVRPLIAIGIAFFGIAVGWYYVGRKGRNSVIFLGVTSCTILLFIEIPITILAIGWN